jgi:hypothetical protein
VSFQLGWMFKRLPDLTSDFFESLMSNGSIAAYRERPKENSPRDSGEYMIRSLSLAVLNRRAMHFDPVEQPRIIDSRMSANFNSPFYRALDRTLNERGMKLTEICPDDDRVARRVLHDYGAMFVATGEVLPPPVCVFVREDEVGKFQRTAGRAAATINGAVVELQPAAMAALLKARAVARREGFDISPRDGAEAARRNFEDTVRLWNSRFLPALEHWTRVGRLTNEQAQRLRALAINQQVAQVLELEKREIFFSKDLSKSVLYSIAPPGASQHIAMLAFDMNEFLDPRIREIMALHGWFQTVLSDLPHFTFLGLSEDELPARGLRPVEANGQKFWIPDVS